MSLKGGIPEEVWSSKLASYDHLCVFACDVFLHLRLELRSKLDVKFMKGIFIDFGDEGEMGYNIWLPQLKNIIHN